jgi:hypothetical protein
MVGMNKLIAIKVPEDSNAFYINNVGCLRYQSKDFKKSTCVEPIQIGEYLSQSTHSILGVSNIDNIKMVIVSKTPTL